nr:MAM and LDL-receptor class A domain-containing protein 1-like [Parasteatoda tepidariorum]
MSFLRTCFIVLVVFGFYASAQLKPYKCDFENGICSFLSNDGANSVNWRIGTGKVKAGDTGPTIDHTKGTSNGSYIFVDVSKASVGSVKLLTRSLTSDYCVQFFYHMYGAHIGDLSVYAQSVYGSENVQYFYRERTQGDRWKQARFSVSQTANMRYKGYKVSFVAKGRAYSGVWGDIALDDLELTPGKCKDTKRDAYDVCSFNDYDCGYTSTRMSSLGWEWKSIHTTSNYFSKQPSQDHTLGTSIGGYWFVGDRGYSASQLNTVMLTSPLYDKPKTSLNCLHFYVYLDHEGTSMWWGGVKENFIQVFLNFPNSKDPRKWIVTKAKNTTEHAEWSYVEAKAEITQKFQIQFTAGLQTPVESIAALDDVKLIAGNCPEAGFCDFEQSKCSWVDGVGDYNWIRKTPSSWSNNEIGPDEDNTLKTDDGNYMVFNTKYKKAGSTASLESEYFPPSKISYCISFYYYMKGSGLGTLKVNVKQENFTEASVWTLKDEQGDMWKQGKTILKPSLMYTRVVFQGITGKGTNAYMALDDIRIRSGETCNLTPPTADPRYEAIEKLSCTFDNLNLCSWKQDTETLSWKFGNGSQFDSTGPKEPLNGKGHYLFVSSYEGSQSNNEKVARISSPSVSSFYPESACFSFYYHMFGAHVGQLRVVLVLMKDDSTPIARQVIWRRSGTQPDQWIQFRDSLNVTAGEYRIEIEAEGGSGFAGDIAIDNILLDIGACPNIDLCDFESSLCGWKVEGNKGDSYYWERGVKMTNGPPNDHTTMTEAGYYLQAVAEDESKVEDKTSLVSPTYNSRWGPHCLTFWYWRPGYAVGKLSVLTRINRVDNLQWQATSDVGKNWHFGQVTINEKKQLQLVIQAEKGTSNAYQMAIDDILIKNSVCGEPANCNFNKDYCSYSQNATSDFAWLLGTGRVVNSQLIENPPSDNSFENGMYAYADMTSPSLQPGQVAVLSSEILLGSAYKVTCVTFYYYIGGEDNSTLSLGKMLLDNSEQDMKYIYKDVFTMNDNTGKVWRVQAQNIAVDAGDKFQIYFKSRKEKGSRSFVAIDDITVADGECNRPTTEPPVIVTEMPKTKFTCNFDDGKMCSWSADNSKIKWTLNKPPQITDKMPKFDHTLGNFQGRYVYIKGDDTSTKEGNLIHSNGADSSWKGNFCVGFWYFMNVEGGKSRLRFQAQHTVRWRTSFVSFWERRGNYGYKWRHAYVHVKSSLNSPKISFAGRVKTGVIAIDDIEAKGGSCPPSKMCTFDDDDDMCSYTQDSKNNMDWDVRSGEDNGTLVKITDHTTQSIEGKYLYIGVNGTSNEKSLRSRIYSPKRPASEASSCVTFYYHIYNVSKLALNTYVATDNGISDPQWSVSIGQGVLWHGARFTVISKQLSWQVVFETEVGNGGYGQVAIDDITIVNRACNDPGACDFEEENCLWENVRPPIEVKDAPVLRALSADVPTDMLKDDFDWIRWIGEEYFGPPRDHTLGTPQGFYMLLDPRFTSFGKTAVYMSERLRAPSGVCLKIWYAIPSYQNGATLQVFVSSDFKKADQLMLIKDPTNAEWKEALVSVIPSPVMDSAFNDFWVFLLGKAGNNTMGYIAIDDISVSEGICEEKTELFDCKNGQHVLTRDVCNFKKDCLNGLDEENCADCDFEKGLCGWVGSNDYYFKWSWERARRKDLSLDHTKGDSSGAYVIASQTWSSGNLRATLASRDLRNAFSTCSMEFYYHLRTGMDFKVTLERSNKSVDIWIPEGNSEDVWNGAQVFLGRIPKTFKVRFFIHLIPTISCNARHLCVVTSH